jgi:hypothetical protein
MTRATNASLGIAYMRLRGRIMSNRRGNINDPTRFSLLERTGPSKVVTPESYKPKDNQKPAETPQVVQMHVPWARS